MPIPSRSLKPRPKSKYTPVELVTASMSTAENGFGTLHNHDVTGDKGTETVGRLAAILLERALQDETFAKALVESSAA